MVMGDQGLGTVNNKSLFVNDDLLLTVPNF
jgi:hypothetical protein